MEEEAVGTQTPFFENQNLAGSPDSCNDANLRPPYSNNTGVNTENQTNTITINRSNVDAATFTAPNVNRRTSITERRNLTNVPSIVTIDHDLNANRKSASSSNEVTTSSSGVTVDQFDQEPTSNNNNPFEMKNTKSSEATDSVQSTNPFIESEQPCSTNPFVEPVNINMGTPHQYRHQEEGRKDDTFKSGYGSAPVTPVSTMSSTESVQDNESPKSARNSYKNKLTNPFKRIVSRHNTKDDDNSERLRVDMNPLPGIARKLSGRRNALHGPF